MDKLKQFMLSLDEKNTVAEVERLLKKGVRPLEIVVACRDMMSIIGNRYSTGDYFLGDLIMSGEIFGEIMQLLRPCLKEIEEPKYGPIIFGTVEGDIHDLGKNITISVLRCSGFGVIDLGVDVPPDAFLEAVVEHKAKILCMSALLTSAFESMKRTVNLFNTAGVRENVKILIGGLVNERVKNYVGADYWTTDASISVCICEQIYQMKDL